MNTVRHLNQAELAERWNISIHTLSRWRMLGHPPNYLKIGTRVVYREDEILAYEEKHIHCSTSSKVHDVGGAS